MSQSFQKILLGVTGGIAAYKAAELLRLLVKQGKSVKVVMTEAACEFVTPLTFQALSGNPVYTRLDADGDSAAMHHINLARWADCILVAPATADFIARVRLGMADDLLTALCLANSKPLIVAPAMNQAMWANCATQENIAVLQQRGIRVIGPEAGEQACGENGLGRMSEPEVIAGFLAANDENKPLHGKRVLITAGPTREPIDPVRFLSNRSSGKMGYALADAACKAGASVFLVSGPVALIPPEKVTLTTVETALEMYQSVMQGIAEADIFIGAAAVSDYRVDHVSDEKIKKTKSDLKLSLTRNPDILAAVANLDQPPFTVGFAAETHDLSKYARGKLRDKGLDMIAANWVGKKEGGFDRDQNALEVFWSGGKKQLSMASKKEIAQQLIALIVERINEKNKN